MPLYFAYGSNLDRVGMAERCPRSRAVGAGRLIGHRFFISVDGYASIRRETGAVVHGIVWDLAFADIAALDRYEEVGRGLYTKAVYPIARTGGACTALVYVGRTVEPGLPKPGYMELVVAAASASALPPAYLRELQRWLPDGSPGVRPRFVSPFDR